jgi:hypothetical protein
MVVDECEECGWTKMMRKWMVKMETKRINEGHILLHRQNWGETVKPIKEGKGTHWMDWPF